MDSQSVEELSCPVCFDIFKAPVLLSCSHSVCKACLQQFWKTKNTQKCPVCRRRSSKEEPPYNLALKNLCELFLRDRREEEVCATHNEKLKLFCLTDKEPVCLVCRDSQKHTHHTFQPINEVVPSYKEELKTALKSLREKLKYREEIKGEYNKTVQHMKTQAEHTELQIKQEFKKLHQFLSDEEQATITALRNEEEKKNQMMKEKLEEINRHISALSNTIKDIEDRMKANDVSFLKNFNVTKERAGVTQPDPEMCCGALIDVPHYLGNLPFRVWKKMQDIVQNKYVALYTYESPEPGDLTFTEGDTILVSEREGKRWRGSIGDRSGVFPSNYVKPKETDTSSLSGKLGTPGKKPEVAQVTTAHKAAGAEQLNLAPGQLIIILTKNPSGWWLGELQLRGKCQKGWFPASHVKLLGSNSGKSTPASTAVGQVIAIYDYTAADEDELSFSKSQVINVLDKSDPDWWKGELNGVTGLIPTNYVKMTTSDSDPSQQWR